MYEFTDKVMKRLARQITERFSRFSKSILTFDSINALQKAVTDCYKDCIKEARKAYLEIGKHYYKEAGGKDDAFIDALWVDHILSDYDPVTKYIFNNEADRKRARTFESIVVSKDPKEVNSAMKYLFDQIKQFADNITDEATLNAYEGRGIRKVKWKTEEDARVCATCGERNNQIYSIGSVPPKPHLRCRCYLLPV